MTKEELYKAFKESAVKYKTIDLWFIYIYWADGYLWFRWFGNLSGYKIKDTRKHPLLFSERNGSGKSFGKWYIKKLKPN